MTRREARTAAFELIFEYDFKRNYEPDTVIANAAECREIKFSGFAKRLFKGACEHIGEIDGYIAEFAEGRELDRISRELLATLRICVYELFFEKDIPVNISVNEAVEIAKKYDTEEGASYINGVLGSIISKNKEKIVKDAE